MAANVRSPTAGVLGATERWSEGLKEETEFWRRWLADKGGRWSFDYRWRTDPDTPLQPYITDNLDPRGRLIRILDVGSGPLTILGKRWGDRTVEITAVDPIADRYVALLDEAGLSPSTPMVNGEAEHVASLFPSNSFDLVFARNCVDHSHDPLRCIWQMLEVVKPRCRVMLAHAIDEGDFMDYAGPHQWNFREEDERFVIWRPGLRVDVTALLETVADVAVHSYPEHRYMSVALTKRPAQRRTIRRRLAQLLGR